MSSEARLTIFQAALEDLTIEDEEFVQRHIIHPVPFVFENDADKYFTLKHEIAGHFGLNPKDIDMVGSAKLGFSIAPHKLWKPFDDDSDIDMVIVSEERFNEFWKSLYRFNIDLTTRTVDEDKRYRRFLKYFFRGWIRPDLFPSNFPLLQEWDDYFKSISYDRFGIHKINGALYRDMHFFETYHVMNIRRLRLGGGAQE